MWVSVPVRQLSELLYLCYFNYFTSLETHTHTHAHARPFSGPFLVLPRWAGTGKVKPIWILLKQETVSGSSMQVVCKSAPCFREITMPATHHSVFYGLNALPAAQATASKHWRIKHWNICIKWPKPQLQKLCILLRYADWEERNVADNSCSDRATLDVMLRLSRNSMSETRRADALSCCTVRWPRWNIYQHTHKHL